MLETREIIATPPEGGDIRAEFDRFLALAGERDWNQLTVLFGFAWGNDAYEDNWIEEVMSPAELKARVDALEENEYGSISDDDLFVTIGEHGTQFTFCHENDIHIKGVPDDPILVAELERYRSLGWRVGEKSKE